MPNWILNRLFDHQDQSPPRFAFQSTMNWMRGLAILVSTDDFMDESLTNHYSNVERRNPLNPMADTYAYERLLMAFHHVAALNQFVRYQDNPYDIVRAAIVSWYYAVYESCNAMVAAESGGTSETHTGTAVIWQAQIIDKGHAVGPFALSIKNLTSSSVHNAMNNLRRGEMFELLHVPDSVDQAWGAIYSYLNGTATYKQKEIEKKIKTDSEFKRLGVSDFRTRLAQQLRDRRLAKGFVNFAVQAFRYRGKANYRDSIYLSYGDDNTDKLVQFVNDLMNVALAFAKMSVHFVACRTEAGTWNDFKSDLDSKCRISINKTLLI